MIRVVVDTNVLVSALLTSGGLPEAVVNLAISGEVRWFVSESVLAEYERVLKRPRLAIDSGKVADAISQNSGDGLRGFSDSARRRGERPRR